MNPFSTIGMVTIICITIAFIVVVISAAIVKRDTEIAKAINQKKVIRCKDCQYFNTSGCAIDIQDESDKPKDNDYCSFAEEKEEENA